MKKQFFALGTAAVMTAFVPNLMAAEAEVEADVDVPKVETRTEVKRDTDISADASVDREKVRDINKASGLLGMEVRNPSNEKLGEIKDLVMDVNSGRISYAVLSVGGFLGIGEKLIALPPSSLKVGEQGDHLILNADKSRIQAAPGFAATAWPAPGDTQINQFWNDIKATGAPASSETSRTRDVDVDADVDLKKDRVDVDTDGSKKKIYTDADKDKNVKVKVDKE